MRSSTIIALIGTATCTICITPGAIAADCTQTSTGLVPIDDLGSGLYLGQFEGGLYPGGANASPPAHANAGLARAAAIVPLAADGTPSPDGKYVLLSIGMSNTTQEFCNQSGTDPCNAWTFMGQADDDPGVNHDTLVIANGAAGGQAAASWSNPNGQNYDRVRDQVLPTLGVTEAQVQAVWVKQANPGPTVSLPDAGADAYVLMGFLGDIARAVKTRYPNCQLIFFSGRIYAGYASSPLNPEPYSYESSFSVKWLIEAQIDQMAGSGIDPNAGDLALDTAAPWLGWGPYLWADGLIPRSDGLTWECSNLANDGTHPSMSGQQMVGTMLLDFFLASPFTVPWFVDDEPICPWDCGDGNGVTGVVDLLQLLAEWGQPGGTCELGGTNTINVVDLLELLANWGPCS